MTQLRPTETQAPATSRIAALIPGSDFHDAWSIKAPDNGPSALDLFIAAARRTPRWIETCMAARNHVARRIGLKHLGTLSGVLDGKTAADFRPGDRVGIFTVFENHFEEALIGDRDKHLDVVLSIHRQALPGQDAVQVTVTTVVHVKNWLGRLYMLPVQPMHRIIAPRVLAGLSQV